MSADPALTLDHAGAQALLLETLRVMEEVPGPLGHMWEFGPDPDTDDWDEALEWYAEGNTAHTGSAFAFDARIVSLYRRLLAAFALPGPLRGTSEGGEPHGDV